MSFSLPKTAFLMFIDYWLIFCLIVPFIVFLIEIAWEFDHNRKIEKASKMVPANKWLGKEDKGETKIKIPYQGLVQLIVIGVTVIYILVYVAFGISFG